MPDIITALADHEERTRKDMRTVAEQPTAKPGPERAHSFLPHDTMMSIAKSSTTRISGIYGVLPPPTQIMQRHFRVGPGLLDAAAFNGQLLDTVIALSAAGAS